jgi:hypothetical protein
LNNRGKILPGVIFLTESFVHLAEDNSELALLAVGKIVGQSPVGKSVIANGRNISLFPGERYSVIFVNVDE